MIQTIVLSRTFSKLWLIINGQIFASDSWSLHFHALAGVISCEYLDKLQIFRN